MESHTESDIVRLWEQAAPGSRGDGLADTPHLIPYRIETERPAPAVIVFPGGGYEKHAPHEGEPIARWLNSLGIASFILKYRFSPYRHPVPLLDAQRAIRLVRYRAAEWGVDPERVGIIGFSAGGHLAATASTQFDYGDEAAPDPVDRMSCRPDLAILSYPVITMEKPFAHEGSVACLLGDDTSDEMRKAMSAEKNVRDDTPPIFLWHATADKAVPVENSLLFARALAAAKVPFSLHVFPGGKHGMSLAKEHPELCVWPTLCATWLRERGFGHGPGATMP